MSIFTRLWQSPARREFVLNVAFVGLFALILVGVVLGTVLPSRHKELEIQDSVAESSDSSSSLVEYFEDVFVAEVFSGTSPAELGSMDVQSELSSGSSLPPAHVTTPVSSNIHLQTAGATTPAVGSHASSLLPASLESVYASSESEIPPSESSSQEPAFWGLTYSPYNDDGSCADINTVSAQLRKVATVACNIRLYSTDCSQLRNALQAIGSSNISMVIHAGIWISDGASRMQSDLDEFVAAAKLYDSSLIKGVSVGNEDVSKGMSEATLVGYINQVRARLQTEGLGHIPVYTTEQDAHFTRALAAASDLIQINVHTVFDPVFTNIAASVRSVIQRANAVKSNIAGNKPVRIGETGWSSAGNTGPSPLTLANEIAYAQKFKCAADAANYEYFYFEAKDAVWKHGQAVAEQNFGIFDSTYAAKFDFGVLLSCEQGKNWMKSVLPLI